MFCRGCGSSIPDGSKFCGNCGLAVETVAAPPSEDGFGQEIVAAVSRIPGLQVNAGPEADIVVRDVLVDADWKVGKKKVQYEALIRLDYSSRTVIMWEMLKEQSLGLGGLASFKVEKYSTSGTTRTGSVVESMLTPDGRRVDFSLEFGKVRQLIQQVAQFRGWNFQMVLNRNKVFK